MSWMPRSCYFEILHTGTFMLRAVLYLYAKTNKKKQRWKSYSKCWGFSSRDSFDFYKALYVLFRRIRSEIDAKGGNSKPSIQLLLKCLVLILIWLIPHLTQTGPGAVRWETLGTRYSSNNIFSDKVRYSRRRGIC